MFEKIYKEVDGVHTEVCDLIVLQQLAHRLGFEICETDNSPRINELCIFICSLVEQTKLIVADLEGTMMTIETAKEDMHNA